MTIISTSTNIFFTNWKNNIIRILNPDDWISFDMIMSWKSKGNPRNATPTRNIKALGDDGG